VVGGAAAEPVDVTATEVEDADVAADGVAADRATDDASEVATVEEVQAPVDDDEAPAGSAAETWAAERANGAERANDAAAAPATPAAAAAEPVTPAAAEVEVEAEPDVREDEEPVLAEAGLLLSEPEMPTESSEDEERPG